MCPHFIGYTLRYFRIIVYDCFPFQINLINARSQNITMHNIYVTYLFDTSLYSILTGVSWSHYLSLVCTTNVIVGMLEKVKCD